MPSYSPKVIHCMRAALNEVMTKIPVDQATQEVKAYMAEIILKAAAEGQTNYEVLLAAASQQIRAVLSQLMPGASVGPVRESALPPVRSPSVSTLRNFTRPAPRR